MAAKPTVRGLDGRNETHSGHRTAKALKHEKLVKTVERKPLAWHSSRSPNVPDAAKLAGRMANWSTATTCDQAREKLHEETVKKTTTLQCGNQWLFYTCSTEGCFIMQGGMCLIINWSADHPRPLPTLIVGRAGVSSGEVHVHVQPWLLLVILLWGSTSRSTTVAAAGVAVCIHLRRSIQIWNSFNELSVSCDPNAASGIMTSQARTQGGLGVRKNPPTRPQRSAQPNEILF